MAGREGASALSDIAVTLSPEDEHVVAHVFGGARFTPEEMSPAVKAIVLAQIARKALSSDDRAFKHTHALASQEGVYAESRKRFYRSVDSGGLRFAPLVAYRPFPSVCDDASVGAHVQISSHLLLQRPEKDKDRAFFWRLEITWSAVNRTDDAKDGFDWHGQERIMRPMFMPALAETLCEPVETAKDVKDPLRIAVASLLYYANWTRNHYENKFKLYDLKLESVLEAASEMGIGYGGY